MNSSINIAWYEIAIKENTKSQIIILDGSKIPNKNNFIRTVYNELWCPIDFWNNWDAFWDTITDEEFWVRNPLILVIKNYKEIFWWNIQDRHILSDILINLILEKRQKYHIYLIA